MNIEVRDDLLKTYHARLGYNKVFGMDVDEREVMSREQLLQRFDKVWTERLHGAIRKAPICSVEDVKHRLKRKQLEYLSEDQEHREFWLESGLFVAQLRQTPSEYELTQLWYIPSSDQDPRVLFIRFDTVAMKKTIDETAQKLGWVPEEMARNIILDFVETVQRRHTPGRERHMDR